MKRPLVSLCVLGLLLGSSGLALARQEPAPVAKPAAEKPKVYDEQADGAAQIAAALAKAKFAHKRVLVQWGANWCGWCLKLHALYRSDKDIAHELSYEYEPVLVDIGKWDKHLELAATYQADFKQHGVPYLTVLDEDGHVVVNQDSSELEIPKGDAHDPARVLGFLKKYQAPPVKADELLAAALSRAAREGKRVFVHFSTPWCIWCRRLEAWMAQPEIAALFEKDYVDLMIDAERYTNAPDVLKRFSAKQPGWPWTVILDAEGHALADSNDAEGTNIGFPSEDTEIAHFLGMLDKTRTHLAPADLETIKRSLVESREARKRAQKPAAPAAPGH